MEQTECNDSEFIIRAIRETNFDREKQRYSSSVFEGQNRSVSRIGVLPKDKILLIYHVQANKRKDQLIATGTIQIKKLKQIAQEYKPEKANKYQPPQLTVIATPMCVNKAHAEIPQKITKGLANRIIDPKINAMSIEQANKMSLSDRVEYCLIYIKAAICDFISKLRNVSNKSPVQKTNS